MTAVLALSAAPNFGQTAPRADMAQIASGPARTADEWFAAAVEQMDEGDYPRARASLDEALRLDPKMHSALMTRAKVLSRLREPGDALADLDAIADSLPPDIFWETKGEILQRTGRHPEAIEAYKALVSLRPKSADAYFRLARARHASDNEAEWPAALDEYNRALKLDPDMLRIYALRGELLTTLMDEVGLEANYQAWLARTPNDAVAHASYAGALVHVGKMDKARTEIDRSLELEPTAQAYLARARMTPVDQREAILADIAKALELSPKSSFAHGLRGQMRARWGQFDLALEDINLALEENPENFYSRGIRYQLHQQAGRHRLAIEDLDALIKRNPGSAALFNDRCWARAIANIELKAALADCETSIALAPGNGSTLDSRGFVKLRLGDFLGAIADYDEALKLQPKLASALFGRGVAKRRQGAASAGEIDLVAARQADAGVEAIFAGYGVVP